MLQETVEQYAGKDLAGDRQERDPVVVVIELAIPFTLVYVNNGSISEIVGKLFLLQHRLAEVTVVGEES